MRLTVSNKSPTQTIVIIDDHVSLAKGFALALEGAGFAAHVAHTAEDGLQLVQTFRPDAIVLDFRMPIADAVTAPRIHHQWLPDEVWVENGLPAAALRDLEKRGQKVYALLREALRKSERWALGSVVVRTKAHVCVLIPQGETLVLNTLRYGDELLPADSVAAPPESLRKAGVTSQEFELALKLVEDMTEVWNPDQYKDTYRRDLMKRVEEKVKKGETHTLTEPTREKPARRSAEIIDLAALLKRSLEEKTAGSARGRGSGARRRAPRTATRRRRA